MQSCQLAHALWQALQGAAISEIQVLQSCSLATHSDRLCKELQSGRLCCQLAHALWQALQVPAIAEVQMLQRCQVTEGLWQGSADKVW